MGCNYVRSADSGHTLEMRHEYILSTRWRYKHAQAYTREWWC